MHTDTSYEICFVSRVWTVQNVKWDEKLYCNNLGQFSLWLHQRRRYYFPRQHSLRDEIQEDSKYTFTFVNNKNII